MSKLANKVIELHEAKSIKGVFGKYGFLSADKVTMEKKELEDLNFKLNDKILGNSDDVIDDLLDKLDDDRFDVQIDPEGKLAIIWPKKAAKHKNLITFYTKIVKMVI